MVGTGDTHGVRGVLGDEARRVAGTSSATVPSWPVLPSIRAASR
ncbi:hypothetical protein HEP87_63720 [Streptomyces sp. S1D4-11]